MCVVKGWFDPVCGALTPLPPHHNAITCNLKKQQQQQPEIAASLHLRRCVTKEKGRILCSLMFRLQLMDCNPSAAASANLPFTVTHGPVPSDSTPRFLRKRQNNKRLVMAAGVSWRLPARPCAVGPHLRGKTWESPRSFLNRCVVGVRLC